MLFAILLIPIEVFEVLIIKDNLFFLEYSFKYSVKTILIIPYNSFAKIYLTILLLYNP